MSTTNDVRLRGRVGKNPKVTQFPDGDRVASLRLATREFVRTGDGGKPQFHDEWHTVRLYGKGQGGLVDRVLGHAGKGAHVELRGVIRSHAMTLPDGSKSRSIYIAVRGSENFEIIEARKPEANEIIGGNEFDGVPDDAFDTTSTA